MFDVIKLKQEINELKAKVNTLQLENELLRDRRIDDLLKALSGEDELEESHKQVKKLETKNQQLKELIKEIKKMR